MNGSRTAIKVLSIIGIVLGALSALMALVLIAGASVVADQMLAVDDATVSVGAISAFAGCAMLVLAAFYIVTGILGIRCANNPAKNTAFVVFCIIAAVLSAIGLLGCLVNGSESASAIISNLLGVGIPVLLIVLSMKAKKETQA